MPGLCVQPVALDFLMVHWKKVVGPGNGCLLAVGSENDGGDVAVIVGWKQIKETLVFETAWPDFLAIHSLSFVPHLL